MAGQGWPNEASLGVNVLRCCLPMWHERANKCVWLVMLMPLAGRDLGARPGRHRVHAGPGGPQQHEAQRLRQRGHPGTCAHLAHQVGPSPAHLSELVWG